MLVPVFCPRQEHAPLCSFLLAAVTMIVRIRQIKNPFYFCEPGNIFTAKLTISSDVVIPHAQSHALAPSIKSQLIKWLRGYLSIIRSDEGLTLETSAFESLYGGQFTLSTQLIKPNHLVILPTDAAPQFLYKLTPPPPHPYHLLIML